MSRTYKDRPYKVRHPEEQWDYRYYPREGHRWYWHCALQRPGVLTKKKKHVDTENHWMTTPMWWVREFMNQPQRVRGKQWERQMVKVPVGELDIQDIPDVGRKPHLYYW